MANFFTDTLRNITRSLNDQEGLIRRYGNRRYFVPPERLRPTTKRVWDTVSSMNRDLEVASEDFISPYIENRYVRPVMDIPSNYRRLTQRDSTWKERGAGALGLVGGVATFFPDPIGDVALPAYDALKGYSRSSREGGSFADNIRSAKEALTLENPAGLGDALTSDDTARNILNIAELPAMLAMGVVKKPKQADNVLKGIDDVQPNAPKSGFTPLPLSLNPQSKKVSEFLTQYPTVGKRIENLTDYKTRERLIGRLEDTVPDTSVKTERASVKAIITKQDKQQLLDLGYTRGQIKTMTPQTVEEILLTSPTTKSAGDIESAVQESYKRLTDGTSPFYDKKNYDEEIVKGLILPRSEAEKLLNDKSDEAVKLLREIYNGHSRAKYGVDEFKGEANSKALSYYMNRLGTQEVADAWKTIKKKKMTGQTIKTFWEDLKNRVVQKTGESVKQIEADANRSLMEQADELVKREARVQQVKKIVESVQENSRKQKTDAGSKKAPPYESQWDKELTRLQNIRSGKTKLTSLQEIDESIESAAKLFTERYRELFALDKETLYKVMRGEIDPPSEAYVRGIALLQDFGEQFKRLEGLPEDQVRKVYMPDYSLEQVMDLPLDDLFPRSKLSSAILDLPHLKAKKGDILPFTTLEDVLGLRIKSGLSNIHRLAIPKINEKLVIRQGEDLVGAIQKGTEGVEKKPFNKALNITFKVGNKEVTFKDKLFGDLTWHWDGWENLGLLDTVRDYYKGMADKIDARLAWDDLADQEVNMIPHWARAMGLEEGTKEYRVFANRVAEQYDRYGRNELLRPKITKILNGKIAEFVYKDKSMQKIEKWIAEHDISNRDTRNWINDRLHEMAYGYEKNSFSNLEELANTIRRVRQLGDIGMNVGTMILQPFETRRIIARYGMDTFAHSLRKVTSREQSPYGRYKMEGDVEYFKGDRKIGGNIVKQSFEKLEDIGYKGIGVLENLKDEMFLHAAEHAGQKRGLTGEALDNFVFDEFRKYAHKYGAADVPQPLKNPIVKLFMMYQTYASKELGLNLRKLEGMLAGNKDKEAQYLATNLLVTAAEAWFMYKVLGMGASYLSSLWNSVSGGIPTIGGPIPQTIGDIAGGVQDYMESDGELSASSKRTLMRTGARWIPYGNQLIMKTGRSIRNMIQGYDPSATGRVRFLSPDDPIDQVRSLLFGPFATEEGKEFINRDSSDKRVFGEKETDAFKKLYEQSPELARQMFENRQNRKNNEKDITGILKKGEASKIEKNEDEELVITAPSGNSYSVLDILQQEEIERETTNTIRDILLRRNSYKDIPEGNEATQILLEQSGATEEEIQTAYLSMIRSIDSKKRAGIVANMVTEGKADFAELYKQEVLTSEVAKEMERQGLIQDADALMEQMKLTDSYYIKKELRKLHKQKVKDMLKQSASIQKKLINQQATEALKLARLQQDALEYEPQKLKPKKLNYNYNMLPKQYTVQDLLRGTGSLPKQIKIDRSLPDLPNLNEIIP